MGSEIPKKERTWVPIRIDPSRRKKLFVAIFLERIRLSAGVPD
jgi:hypothetical protein